MLIRRIKEYKNNNTNSTRKGKKSKAVTLTGREDPEVCERSRFPHFLDNRLKDGGKVVNFVRRQPFTPQEVSWYSYLLEAKSTPGS
jgi:hypothetical protein